MCKEPHGRRDSLWTKGPAGAGMPLCSSASLTPSLITPPPAFPSAPLASFFAVEHVEQASSSGPLAVPAPSSRHTILTSH